MDWSEEIPPWALAITRSLLQALKQRDPYTYGHCQRVARLAKKLALAAGLNEREATAVELASVFHDIGKIGIPDRVLLKPDQLNSIEEQLMREHPIKSAEILEPLSKIPIFRATLPGIRCHHERIDGAGYPYGLSKEDIPLSARIILIADSFDAMTTTRPYRKGLPLDVAYTELKIFSGRQFDPYLVRTFLEAHPHWSVARELFEESLVDSEEREAA